MASALDGFTVLDLGSGAAAAMATMFLSDHGARVVRVLDCDGALHRDGGFIIWDRGKAAVRLDLTAACTAGSGAAGSWERLVRGADVIVDDFAPSDRRQALVDRSYIRRLNPRCVAASITAYGKLGPLKDEPAIDDLVLARMGVLSGMPGFRPPPVHVVHPLPSVGAAMLAVTGIAAALLARESTRRGRGVETSLMAGALLYHPKVLGERLKRHVFQTHPGGSSPFYSLYQCSDGKWVQLGCVHAGFIRVAARLMGIEPMVDDPRFDGGRGGITPADDAEIRKAVADVVKTRPLADWIAAFEAADVPYAPARWTEESLDDPQIAHNGMAVILQDPVKGSVRQMGVPVALGTTAGHIQGARASAVSRLDDVLATWPSFKCEADAADGDVDPPPLAGVRVLEMTNLIAGPTAGRLLADLGADVLKLEPPEGDMARPIGRTYFYHVNFNKRSICFDARTPEGRAAVCRIAASSDALVANVRPGATERMGIGPKLNPRLIETHLTGYGWTGPYSARPGIDPLAQAYMGLSRAQGGLENPPVFPAQLAPTDYTTGAMGAFGTILALLVRARTGIVQRVDCNLLSGGILLTSPWFSVYEGKPSRPLADKAQMGLGPFHRLYKLEDGWIYVAADGDKEPAALLAACRVDPKLDAAVADEHPNDGPLAKALAAHFAGLPVARALGILKSEGVPAIEVVPGDSETFLDDPHAQANGMVTARQHPTGGRLRVASGLVQFSNTAETLGRPTPLLGEHTAEVLAGLGYRGSEIAPIVRAATKSAT